MTIHYVPFNSDEIIPIEEEMAGKKVFKTVLKVAGIAAAFFIPYAAPAIANAIGISGAIGSAVVGAGLGAGTAALSGGNVGLGAALGGLGGGLGGLSSGASSTAMATPQGIQGIEQVSNVGAGLQGVSNVPYAMDGLTVFSGGANAFAPLATAAGGAGALVNAAGYGSAPTQADEIVVNGPAPVQNAGLDLSGAIAAGGAPTGNYQVPESPELAKTQNSTSFGDKVLSGLKGLTPSAASLLSSAFNPAQYPDVPQLPGDSGQSVAGSMPGGDNSATLQTVNQQLQNTNDYNASLKNNYNMRLGLAFNEFSRINQQLDPNERQRWAEMYQRMRSGAASDEERRQFMQRFGNSHSGRLAVMKRQAALGTNRDTGTAGLKAYSTASDQYNNEWNTTMGRVPDVGQPMGFDSALAAGRDAIASGQNVTNSNWNKEVDRYNELVQRAQQDSANWNKGTAAVYDMVKGMKSPGVKQEDNLWS